MFALGKGVVALCKGAVELEKCAAGIGLARQQPRVNGRRFRRQRERCLLSSR